MNSTVIVSRMLFALLITQGSLSLATSQRDFYERGVDLRTEGEWEQALKTWWDGYSTLRREGSNDPRIAIAFVELSTEMKAEKYYGTACEMYFWNFSHENLNNYADVVEEEFVRIAPFLDDKDYEDWWLKLESGEISAVAKKVKQFWRERDPTPTTLANERFILHWLRIAHARKNFTKNRKSVYGTDDRGLVYVAYGEPVRKSWGYFGSKYRDTNSYIVTGNEFLDSNVGRGLLQQIRSSNHYPEYEIWVYQSNSEDSAIFMFGKSQKTGIYETISGVEDLISDLTFTNIDHFMLQIMYYEQLIEFDPFFKSRHGRLLQIASLMARKDESRKEAMEKLQRIAEDLDLQRRSKVREPNSGETQRRPRAVNKERERLINEEKNHR